MNTACPATLPPAASPKKSGWQNPSQLSDHELLVALFDRLLPEGQSTPFAVECLDRFGGFKRLLSAARQESHGANRPVLARCWTALALFDELFRRQLYERIDRGSVLASPADTTAYLQHQLGGRHREIFLCLFLDTRHRVICSRELFQGSIDGASVHPRVVAEHALRYHAAAVIVAHNHPSGVAEPSLADQAITRRLKDALSLLEIRLLDHFVIGESAPVSMAARGML